MHDSESKYKIGMTLARLLRVDLRPLVVLVLGNATPSQPVNLPPSFPVVDELTEHNKVEEYSAEASNKPREALDEVLALCALQEDTCDIGEVTCHGKDEKREREALALCRAVFQNLRDTRREVEDGREPTCNLCIPSPADGFGDSWWLVCIVVAAIVVFGDPPSCDTGSDNEESGKGIHDDLCTDRGFVLVVSLGGEVVLDDTAIANQGCALIGFERGRDGGNLDPTVVVFGIVPVLKDKDAVASAIVECENDL